MYIFHVNNHQNQLWRLEKDRTAEVWLIFSEPEPAVGSTRNKVYQDEFTPESLISFRHFINSASL